ncbi:MAG: hypothetical protein WD966_06790 [Nitrosopumilaceae archaeon]
MHCNGNAFDASTILNECVWCRVNLVMSIAGIVFMTGRYKVLGFPKI